MGKKLQVGGVSTQKNAGLLDVGFFCPHSMKIKEKRFFKVFSLIKS